MMLRDISKQFNMEVQFIMTDADYLGTTGKHKEKSHYALSERLVIRKNNSHR